MARMARQACTNQLQRLNTNYPTKEKKGRRKPFGSLTKLKKEGRTLG
jgi:hypothetical protein